MKFRDKSHDWRVQWSLASLAKQRTFSTKTKIKYSSVYSVHRFQLSSTSKPQQNISLSNKIRPLPSGAHLRFRVSNFSVQQQHLSVRKRRRGNKTHLLARRYTLRSLSSLLLRHPRPTHHSTCISCDCRSTWQGSLCEPGSIGRVRRTACAQGHFGAWAKRGLMVLGNRRCELR